MLLFLRRGGVQGSRAVKLRRRFREEITYYQLWYIQDRFLRIVSDINSRSQQVSLVFNKSVPLQRANFTILV